MKLEFFSKLLPFNATYFPKTFVHFSFSSSRRFLTYQKQFSTCKFNSIFFSNCLSANFLSAEKLQKMLVTIFAPVERFLVCEFCYLHQDTFWVIMIEFGKATLASVWDEDLTFFKKRLEVNIRFVLTWYQNSLIWRTHFAYVLFESTLFFLQ